MKNTLIAGLLAATLYLPLSGQAAQNEKPFSEEKVSDFLVVLMTKNLSKQGSFYKDVLGLDLMFESKDTIGVGKDGRLFIVIREDKSEESHHLSEHKGPQIITFKCQGDINHYADKITGSGFKVRDTLKVPQYKTEYLFIEDYDGNEICLDFPL